MIQKTNSYMSKKIKCPYDPLKFIEFSYAKAKLERETGINFKVSRRTAIFQTPKGILKLTDRMFSYTDSTMGGVVWMIESEDGTKFRVGDIDTLSNLIKIRL